MCFNGKKSSLCCKAAIFCPFPVQKTRALSFFIAAFTCTAKWGPNHHTDYLCLFFLDHFFNTKRSSHQQTAGFLRKEHGRSAEAAPGRWSHSMDTLGSHLQNTWNIASWFNGISHYSCTDRNDCSKYNSEESRAQRLAVLDLWLL